MCFSAEASFTVGTVLGVIGIATLKKVKNRNNLLIALFPILFGIQQFLEGIIWLYMDETFIRTPFSQVSVNLYLFFAWLFWPVFVPIAFYAAETVKWKKAFFAFALLLGFTITFVDIRYLATHSVTPVITGRSLNYGFTPFYGNVIYGLSSFIPIFLSSIPRMKVFGTTLLSTFILSQLIYTYTFTSVWCFFCAAVSVILYKILCEAESDKYELIQS